MRLSTRFALCAALVAPVVVVLSGVLILRLAVGDLRSERDHRLVARLKALTPLASSFAQRNLLFPAGAGSLAGERISAAASTGTSGGGVHLELADGTALRIGRLPAALPPPSAGPAETADGAWRYASAPLGLTGRAGRLWVFDPEADLTAQVAHLREQLLLATLVAAVAGAAAGFALGRFAVRPLTRLSGQAGGIDLRTGGGRLDSTSNVTEIDELARLVNALLDRRDGAVARMDEALQTARAFAATAAHELRTPLTSMRANLRLLDHPAVDEPGRKEILSDVLTEQDRIQRLVTMLRQLARGELLDPTAFAGLDLTELVGAAAEDARRRHPHAVVALYLDEPLPVRGWPEGLRMVVDNLLDNAAVHGTGPGGAAHITVTVARAGDRAVLEVADGGPGIPEDRRAAVFDRFTRRPDSPGSGLGMTLIHQQVVLHSGTVTVAPAAPGAGARVRVEFPPAAAGPDGPGVLSWLTLHGGADGP